MVKSQLIRMLSKNSFDLGNWHFWSDQGIRMAHLRNRLVHSFHFCSNFFCSFRTQFLKHSHCICNYQLVVVVAAAEDRVAWKTMEEEEGEVEEEAEEEEAVESYMLPKRNAFLLTHFLSNLCMMKVHSRNKLACLCTTSCSFQTHY